MGGAFAFAQDASVTVVSSSQPPDAVNIPEQPAAAAEISIQESLAASDNVTLDFKEADIRNILKLLAQKANVNIVPTADVIGTVTIKLKDVAWERALDIILKSNGFGFQKQGNVILVTKIENIAKIQSEEPLRTEIVHLKFLDAQDAQRILVPMLSPRGKISILFTHGQKGWKFGSFKIGKEEVATTALEREKLDAAKSETISIGKSPAGVPVASKMEFEPSIKSKILVITDTDANLDNIINKIVPEIDRKPKQVLIEARIMEVNVDKLKDIGVDYGTGTTGATTSTPVDVTTGRKGNSTIGGSNWTSKVVPSVFGAKAASLAGMYPYNAGVEVLFKKLTGNEFEILLHALEEDVKTNTLSSPRILTLDNQEASILVGYHTPILKSEVDAGDATTGSTQTQTLDYYQEIGIRLNVVPQISQEGFINMIIHPSVTSSSSNVTATNTAGSGSSAITSTVNYPIIDVREAQTQILMRDSETIVIGGLLKDVKSKSKIGVPFLSKIPLLGSLFTRETNDIAKVDLLIFITARVIEEDEFTKEDIQKMQKSLGFPVLKKELVQKNK